MANEITARWHDSGSTLYAQVLNTTGAVYNGSTFETPADANWGNYDIALTEEGTTRFYRGTFPAITAGLYTVLLYEQAGGSPAVADTLIGLGEVQWDGSAAVPMATILADTNELQTNQGNWLTATGFSTHDAAAVVTALESTQLPDSTPAVGARPTWGQALLGASRFMMEKEVTGATLTVYKEDGTTAVMTFTLDDGDAPTSITRAS